MGGIVACGYAGVDACSDILLTNNIVSGTVHSGLDSAAFSFPAQDCGNYEAVTFKDNVAHSNGGYGGIAYKASWRPNQVNCIEVNNFVAYKCRFVGFAVNQASPELRLSNMTFIDNGFSMSAHIGIEGENLKIFHKNITYYGESEARDCPYKNFCAENKN